MIIFFQFSRGSKDPRKMTSSSFKYHIKHVHPEVELAPAAESSGGSTDPQVSTAVIRKRGGSSYAYLYSLCSKQRRTELFQTTIEGWIEAKTMLKDDSPKAQRFHKYIFEWLVMDLQPWHAVSKVGFIRMQQVQVGNFKVNSAKHYREMLDPAYERVKSGMHDSLVLFN